MSRPRSPPVRRRWSDALSRVSWQELERLLVQHYRDAGFQVQHTGTAHTGGRTDGGIDLKLRKDDQYLVVECKHWNTDQVPHNDVHELLGIMATERATGAIFVTSGEFSDAAIRRMAGIPNYQMIDGTALRTMLGRSIEELGPTSPAPGPAAEMRRRGTTKPARNAPIELLLKLGFALLVLWAGQRVMQGAIKGLDPANRTGARQMQVQRPSANVPRVVQSTASPAVQPAYPSPAPAVQPSAAERAAELREWKRKSAESVKILEATTPEM